MSTLNPVVPSISDDGEWKISLKRATAPADLMSEDGHPDEKPHNSGMSAVKDARALVRLIQCPQCSKPYSTPVTLPCGNSLCRECIPEAHRRENVTYPDLPGRRRAFPCPFEQCTAEHTMADCSVDVTLNKVMISINQVVAKNTPTVDDETPTLVEEVLSEQTTMSQYSEKSPSRVLPGGRLIATFNLAASGTLNIKTDLSYQTMSSNGDDYSNLDQAVLAQLLETTHKELDCQVCYNLMLDPVTTTCGHTFCRTCLVRTLDHSQNCPVCRRSVLLPPSLHSHPSNKALVNLLIGLCPDVVSARAEALLLEEAVGMGELDTPLFVCTLGFPGCPTFLQIFEPRYRLMIRRVLEGNRQFGILMYNRHGVAQANLGNVQFMEYGTLLRIENVQFLADGRSIIETKGVSRFRVKAHDQLDGYTVGNIERVEDVSVAEEERLEAEETSLAPAADNDIEGQIRRMPTRELLMLGLEFIIRMQGRSAHWLHERILQAYGGPPEDAALFPFWFASILPINDEWKYQLLQTTSVRARLKITAMWIKHFEQQRW